jgi:hypothetical protein
VFLKGEKERERKKKEKKKDNIFDMALFAMSKIFDV